ncbi:MAG TPA: hypothetical protein VHA15_03285 [Burkholderiales bacterium]|jgi:hypothetical protein|nr:hypothetical protein [Burkholderiales bacterium]
MSEGVRIVSHPGVAGKRRCQLLIEDRIGHYPEFRDFFVRRFDLDRIGLQAPGYLAAPSGLVYELCFLGRSGEPFPSGVEVSVLVDALEPFDEAVVDGDLWEILRWMIEGVGAPWSVSDLDATGRLYRIPAMRDTK